MNINRIREDLSFLSDKEVVIFGSFVRGDFGPTSDIDIAIITRDKDKKKNLEIRIEALGRAPKCYDIHIFEELPLALKGIVIENYIVLFGDPLEIGMYFYHFRKLWEDFRHRIEIPTIAEIRKSIREH